MSAVREMGCTSKATPASTLRNTDSMVRIKSPHMGERKTIHVLYIVFQSSGI